MALSYDLTDVQSRDTSDAGWQRTESVIWACMALGMNGIKDEDEAHEFWIRLRILRKLGDWGPLLVWLDILNHVGISTNVSPETRKQWLKRMVEGVEREQGYQAVRDRLNLDAQREALIDARKLSPAAREMAWPVLENQYREANALTFEEARAELLGK